MRLWASSGALAFGRLAPVTGPALEERANPRRP